MIKPAQVPIIGMPLFSSISLSIPSKRNILEMVVLSPPGIIKPSHCGTTPARFMVTILQSKSFEDFSRAVICSETAPWMATTPIVNIEWFLHNWSHVVPKTPTTTIFSMAYNTTTMTRSVAATAHVRKKLWTLLWVALGFRYIRIGGNANVCTEQKLSFTGDTHAFRTQQSMKSIGI